MSTSPQAQHPAHTTGAPLRRREILGWMAGAPAVALGLGATGSAAFAQEPLPKEFRIGFQKGSALLVLVKKQAVIEKRLQSLGVASVKWVEFQFGPPMLEALGAGAIDLGSVGDTPPVFAQAGGSPLLYAASTPSAQHAVLVPRNSPIKSVADLKGKKVAFGKGSSAHNVAVKALAQAGLRFADIQPTYLAPADATAAFTGGSIDAWVVWDPYFAIAQERYDARVLVDTSDKRLASASYYMTGKSFAERHPRVLEAALQEIGRSTTWAGEHRDELATLAAEATGIDAKSWRTAFARAEFSFGPVTDAQVAQQQQLADSFQSLGFIPRPIDVAQIVWRGSRL